jgi:hypothetical protein
MKGADQGSDLQPHGEQFFLTKVIFTQLVKNFAAFSGT